MRITPACAGNRQQADTLKPFAGDHPRLRGEQYDSLELENDLEGSPPLARGTADGRKSFYGKAGITPACAGNRIIEDVEKPRL